MCNISFVVYYAKGEGESCKIAVQFKRRYVDSDLLSLMEDHARCEGKKLAENMKIGKAGMKI